MSGIAAYQKQNQQIRTPRDQERDVIALVTQRIREAASMKDPIILAKAIGDNIMMWTVLMSDLSSKENQLPVELKGQLISVGMAVVRECEKPNIMEVDTDFVVEVNSAIIGGLR